MLDLSIEEEAIKKLIMAKANLSNELLRLIVDVEQEFENVIYYCKDKRTVQVIINQHLAKKKQNDARYIQAEKTLEKAEKEFHEIMK